MTWINIKRKWGKMKWFQKWGGLWKILYEINVEVSDKYNKRKWKKGGRYLWKETRNGWNIICMKIFVILVHSPTSNYTIF